MTTTVDTDALTAELDAAAAHLAAARALAVDPEEPDQPPIVPPVARGDAVSVQTGATAIIDLWANDEPGSAPIASVRILQPTVLGSVTLNDGHAAYTAGGQAGADSLLYQDIAEDGGESIPATLAITVTAPNPPDPKPPGPAPKGLCYHGATSQGVTSAAPPDVLAVAATIAKDVTPKAAQPKLIPAWLGKKSYKLMRPGADLKANFFQQVTDKGGTVLLSFPMCWDEKPPGCPANTSPFEDVIAGRYNQIWADTLGWMAQQGQTAPYLRWVEPNGSFPWAARHSRKADFSDVKAAAGTMFQFIRKTLPKARIVISWFHDGFGIANGQKIKIHPEEIAPDQKYYDGNHLDWYDGWGKPCAPDNVDAMYAATGRSHLGKVTPLGADAWRAWNNSRKCADGSTPSWALDEIGIRDDINGDNPYFYQSVQDRMKTWGDVKHFAIFKPQTGVTRIFPATKSGGTKSLAKVRELWNVAI